MPLYAYRCPNGHDNDVRRPAARASEPVMCPDCGERALRRYQLRGIGLGPGTHNGEHPGTRYPGRR